MSSFELKQARLRKCYYQLYFEVVRFSTWIQAVYKPDSSMTDVHLSSIAFSVRYFANELLDIANRLDKESLMNTDDLDKSKTEQDAIIESQEHVLKDIKNRAIFIENSIKLLCDYQLLDLKSIDDIKTVKEIDVSKLYQTMFKIENTARRVALDANLIRSFFKLLPGGRKLFDVRSE